MLLSVVIPLFNEENALPFTLKELRRVLGTADFDYELIFVDDGSRDRTAEMVAAEAGQDARIKLVRLSRNFGHQVAVTAGLDFANGDAVAVMDADLQDPPELLPKMVDLYRQGFQVVSPQRTGRESDTWFKRFTARAFYTLMRKMVDPRLRSEVGDFRLFSREAVLAMRRLREQHRFMRGLVAWLGLRETVIPFHRSPRVAGETKYPLWKMLRFAWVAMSSFSALPLKLTIWGGFTMCAFGLIYTAYSIYQAEVVHAVVPGWTSLVCLQTTFSGFTLIAIGLVGDYIARVYEETKQRPLYVVNGFVNLERPTVERAVILGGDENAASSAHPSRG